MATFRPTAYYTEEDYAAAVQACREANGAGASVVQRACRCGYWTASEIIADMVRRGDAVRGEDGMARMVNKEGER